jgi:hypothetical protein
MSLVKLTANKGGEGRSSKSYNRFTVSHMKHQGKNITDPENIE